MEETAPYFQNSQRASSITNTYAREFGTTVFVFTVAKIDINKRIAMEIIKKKNY